MKPWRPLLLSGLLACQLAVAGEVAAPFWGDVLFRVYQGQTFGALTTLMASRHFERIAPHDDEAEATRAGLLVAYGQHAQAEALFIELAERGSTPAMRDRAWLAVARLRWQRGLVDQAEAALQRVGDALDAGQQDERALLAAQLRLAAGDAAGAAARLQVLQAHSPYARYNLGVALLRQGERDAGGRWLDQLAQQPAADPEQRSLRDRARLALGFAALQAGQPQQARAQLQQLRLNGPFSNAALLGFGWAAAQLTEPREALVPWQELLARDPSDAAVLEARLAVPYALAELGAFAQAEQGYQQALQAYALEHRALEATLAAVRSGRLVDALLARNPGEDLGWLWQASDLPELPHPAQLLPLLATHAFQEALKDQRDLRFLQANLERWSRDLVVFDDMLATRRQAYAQRLPALRLSPHAPALATLRSQRQALAETLAKAQAEDDGTALASAAERALLARRDRVRSALAQQSGAEMDEARERLRRVEGALVWQLSQAQPERLWAARKALQAVDRSLAGTDERIAALNTARHDEPARFDVLAGRIAALALRIGQQLPIVAAVQAEQQQALQHMAVEALQAQQQRLAEFETQARFALAQLQDRATLAQSPPGAGDAAPR